MKTHLSCVFISYRYSTVDENWLCEKLRLFEIVWGSISVGENHTREHLEFQFGVPLSVGWMQEGLMVFRVSYVNNF